MEKNKGRISALIIQDRVLRKIFGSRGVEVTWYWRRWHIDEINDPYSLPNVILLIISRKTRCVGLWRGWDRGILWFVVGMG